MSIVCAYWCFTLEFLRIPTLARLRCPASVRSFVWLRVCEIVCQYTYQHSHMIFMVVFVTGALIWYCPVTTTRTADTSNPMSRVLPHNHQTTSAPQNIADSVLIMISNVCFIKINNFSMISIVAILFLSCGMSARCTIFIINA